MASINKKKIKDKTYKARCRKTKRIEVARRVAQVLTRKDVNEDYKRKEIISK